MDKIETIGKHIKREKKSDKWVSTSSVPNYLDLVVGIFKVLCAWSILYRTQDFGLQTSLEELPDQNPALTHQEQQTSPYTPEKDLFSLLEEVCGKCNVTSANSTGQLYSVPYITEQEAFIEEVYSKTTAVNCAVERATTRSQTKEKSPKTSPLHRAASANDCQLAKVKAADIPRAISLSPSRIGLTSYYTHRSLPDLGFLDRRDEKKTLISRRESSPESSLFDPVKIPIILSPVVESPSSRSASASPARRSSSGSSPSHCQCDCKPSRSQSSPSKIPSKLPQSPKHSKSVNSYLADKTRNQKDRPTAQKPRSFNSDIKGRNPVINNVRSSDHTGNVSPHRTTKGPPHAQRQPAPCSRLRRANASCESDATSSVASSNVAVNGSCTNSLSSCNNSHSGTDGTAVNSDDTSSTKSSSSSRPSTSGKYVVNSSPTQSSNSASSVDPHLSSASSASIEPKTSPLVEHRETRLPIRVGKNSSPPRKGRIPVPLKSSSAGGSIGNNKSASRLPVSKKDRRFSIQGDCYVSKKNDLKQSPVKSKLIDPSRLKADSPTDGTTKKYPSIPRTKSNLFNGPNQKSESIPETETASDDHCQFCEPVSSEVESVLQEVASDDTDVFDLDIVDGRGIPGISADLERILFQPPHLENGIDNEDKESEGFTATESSGEGDRGQVIELEVDISSPKSIGDRLKKLSHLSEMGSSASGLALKKKRESGVDKDVTVTDSNVVKTSPNKSRQSQATPTPMVRRSSVDESYPVMSTLPKDTTGHVFSKKNVSPHHNLNETGDMGGVKSSISDSLLQRRWSTGSALNTFNFAELYSLQEESGHMTSSPESSYGDLSHHHSTDYCRDVCNGGYHFIM